MSQNAEKQREMAIKWLEEILADMTKFIKVLDNDYQFSRQVLSKNPADNLANQMLRRTAIRNFCALVEGQIHAWKWTTLSFFDAFAVNLDAAEIAMLKEESYDLDNSGKTVTKCQNLSVSKNFKFGCKMYFQVFECSYVVNFRSEGWACVLKTFDVRNRLMHPKQSKGIEVSDSELQDLQRANDWLREVRLGLVESCDFEKVQEKIKLKKSLELN